MLYMYYVGSTIEATLNDADSEENLETFIEQIKSLYSQTQENSLCIIDNENTFQFIFSFKEGIFTLAEDIDKYSGNMNIAAVMSIVGDMSSPAPSIPESSSSSLVAESSGSQEPLRTTQPISEPSEPGFFLSNPSDSLISKKKTFES